MKLLSVRIENYKLCKDVTIDINDRLTALLGRNGSGKTTILQAFNLLSSNGDRHWNIRFASFDVNNFDVTTITAKIEDAGAIYHYRVKAYFDKKSANDRFRMTVCELNIPNSKIWFNYDDVE